MLQLFPLEKYVYTLHSLLLSIFSHYGTQFTSPIIHVLKLFALCFLAVLTKMHMGIYEFLLALFERGKKFTPRPTKQILIINSVVEIKNFSP